MGRFSASPLPGMGFFWGGLSFFGALPVSVGRREQTLLRYLTWSDSLEVVAGWAQDAVDGLCRRGPQLPSGRSSAKRRGIGAGGP